MDTPGLRWMILRPGVVYGPGDRALLPLFKLAERGPRCRSSDARTPPTPSCTSTMSSGRLPRQSTRLAVGEVLFVGHSAAGQRAGDSRRDSAGSRPPGDGGSRPAGDHAAGRGGMRSRRARWSGGRLPLTRWRYVELSAPGFVCHVDRLRDRLGIVAEIDLRCGTCRYRRVVSPRRLDQTVSVRGATPTRSKTSSARVICSTLCAAEQLARSTHSSRGQPGGTIRFT